MGKDQVRVYQAGDEISYAQGTGIAYGTVLRVVERGDAGAVEIKFEDGRKEIKKTRDRALSLVRRATGTAEADERRSGGERVRDPDVERIRRGEQRRRS